MCVCVCLYLSYSRNYFFLSFRFIAVFRVLVLSLLLLFCGRKVSLLIIIVTCNNCPIFRIYFQQIDSQIPLTIKISRTLRKRVAYLSGHLQISAEPRLNPRISGGSSRFSRILRSPMDAVLLARSLERFQELHKRCVEARGPRGSRGSRGSRRTSARGRSAGGQAGARRGVTPTRRNVHCHAVDINALRRRVHALSRVAPTRDTGH